MSLVSEDIVKEKYSDFRDLVISDVIVFKMSDYVYELCKKSCLAFQSHALLARSPRC